MLAGVLLHVVEAPPPINLARHLIRPEFAFDDVNDRIVFGADENIENGQIVQRAEVMGLAAGGGIEITLIQDNG
jgi:hypothetical protein